MDGIDYALIREASDPALPPLSSNQYTRFEWRIPTSTRNSQGEAIPINLTGKVATLTFKLDNTVPGPVFGNATVWIDDVALVVQPGVRGGGPGLPVVANEPLPSQMNVTPLTAQLTDSVLGSAVAQWMNLNQSVSIEVPDWQGGVQAGSLFFAAPNIHIDSDVPDVGFQFNGNTSFLESGFHDQLLFENLSAGC